MGKAGKLGTKYALLVKHGLYVLLFLLLYVAQSTPDFLVLGGVKPLWVIPAALAVAMLEGELVGGIYGAFAGLLCDINGPLLFGFNGFLTCLFCVATGLLVVYLMRCNLLSCVLFVGVFAVVRGHLEFLFAFGMWNYENIWKLYVWRTLPVIAYTIAVSPLLFWLLRRLHRYFAPDWETAEL